MLHAIATLITLELIGLAAFPFVARAFPLLADRGWAIAKPVGMLLIASGVWLASYTRLVPNSPFVWWAFLFILAMTSLLLLRSDWKSIRSALKRRWRIIVALELLFITFFLLFLVLRAFNPSAAGTEKPMDLMLLTAVGSTQYAPPQDLWLSGEPIAYYYFGYWMYGGVNAMAGTAPATAFNIGIALVAGLAASISASLVITLIRRDGATTKTAMLAGSAAPVLLLVVSNMSGLWTLLDITRTIPGWLLNWYHGAKYDHIEKIVTWRPDDFWWWWNSSRIINSYSADGKELDFTIQEFPFFSLLLGDFHPHLMSIPFVLTGFTVLFGVFLAIRSTRFNSFRRNIPAFFITSIVLGSSGFINFWDVGLLLLLSTGLVVVSGISIRPTSLKNVWSAALPMGMIWISGIIIFSPFYFGTAESQIQWPPIAPVKYGTRPIHFLSVWLLMIIAVIPVVLVLARSYFSRIYYEARGHMAKQEAGEATIWKPAWLTGLMLVVIPWLGWVIAHLTYNVNSQVSDLITRLPVSGGLGLLCVVLIAVSLSRARRGADDGAQYILILGTLAIYLLLAAELFFVHDLFGNRMNTVFKFYYQAWIILALVGAYGIFLWLKHHPTLIGRYLWISKAGIVLLGVFVFSSLWFSVASAVTKTVNSDVGPTLDSLSFLATKDSDEKEVIDRIRHLAVQGDVVLEAVGGSYSENGRISGSSGVPTPLGWVFHERQWRGSMDSFSDREKDVAAIYTSDNRSELIDLIDKYLLTFVVIGPRERSAYGKIDLALFDTLGERIIENGDYTVFSIRR